MRGGSGIVLVGSYFVPIIKMPRQASPSSLIGKTAPLGGRYTPSGLDGADGGGDLPPDMRGRDLAVAVEIGDPLIGNVRGARPMGLDEIPGGALYLVGDRHRPEVSPRSLTLC